MNLPMIFIFSSLIAVFLAISSAVSDSEVLSLILGVKGKVVLDISVRKLIVAIRSLK